MNRDKLRRTVERVVGLFEKEAYEELETLSGGNRLSAEEMKEAVTNYGRKIAPFPEAGYKELDIVEVDHSNPKRWSVYISLFTDDEGRSDLTLSVTLTESATSLFKVEIEDIHVL
jgi:hypothetical protein